MWNLSLGNSPETMLLIIIPMQVRQVGEKPTESVLFPPFGWPHPPIPV